MTAVQERMRRAQLQSRERAWGHLGKSLGPRVAGLAVADAEEVLDQREVLDRLGLCGDEFAEGIFARCGVRRRHLHLRPEFLELTLQGRAEHVERELFARAVKAVEQLAIEPAAIGTVVSSSLYSLGCPTLAHRLLEHFGMDAATDKYHLTGVGCASAVPLMRLATQSLQRHPRKQVLVVAAESMSSILTRASDGDARAKTVGSAIFGDGCAAALLAGDPAGGGPVIRGSQVHQIPGSLDAVSLATGSLDSHLHLARELPELAAGELEAIVERFLRARNLRAGAIDHWIVHPGGRRIIEGVRDALSLSDEDVALSWEALAEHGNVGTPSIFYVLRDTIAQRNPGAGELGLAVTIGPGVTIGLMLLQW